MTKPNIYILNWGSIGAANPDSNLGNQAYSADVTVGLTIKPYLL